MIHESELMVNDIVEYANEGIACFCRIKGIGDGQVLLRTLKDKGEYVATFDDIRPVALSEHFFKINDFLHGTNVYRSSDVYVANYSECGRVEVYFYDKKFDHIEIQGSSRLTSNKIKDIHSFQNALRNCGLKDLANKLFI